MERLVPRLNVGPRSEGFLKIEIEDLRLRETPRRVNDLDVGGDINAEHQRQPRPPQLSGLLDRYERKLGLAQLDLRLEQIRPGCRPKIEQALRLPGLLARELNGLGLDVAELHQPQETVVRLLRLEHDVALRRLQ
jgi:hypothetical protein